MGYQVGDLDLSLQVISAASLSSLDQVINRLEKITSMMKSFTKMSGSTGSNFSWVTRFGSKLESLDKKISSSNLQKISSGFDSIANSLLKVDKSSLSWINTLGTKFTNLDKKLKDVDFARMSSNFSKMAKAIDPFLRKIMQAEKGLVALSTATAGMNKVQKVSATAGSFFGARSFLGFGSSIYFARRLGNLIANAVQAASDYNETLNLWQVAFRNNLDLADEFIEKMNKAYGISEKALMQYQATFKNMLSSLGGLAEQSSYYISEYLTQLALDFSSLYNVQIENAMEKFQAVLAGQVRPIRSVSGYDITETTIFDLYQRLGGTKTVRQLDQVEKRLLRILAVVEQMGASGAIGDMTKTINQFANQSRIMTELWQENLQWAGTLLKLLLDENQILIRINAALIVTRELFKSLAYQRGYKKGDFLSGMFETAEEVNEEVDKLQGKLLDFDEFRVLSQGTEPTAISIDENILNALTGYSSFVEDTENLASELAEEWMKIVGLTDKNGDGIYEISDGLRAVLELTKSLGIALSVLAFGKIVKWIFSFSSGLTVAASSVKILNVALVSGLIWSVTTAINAFKEGEKSTAAWATALSVLLFGAIVLVNAKLNATLIKTVATYIWYYGGLAVQSTIKFAKQLLSLATASNIAKIGVLGLGATFGLLLGEGLNYLPTTMRGIAGALLLVAGAATAAAIAVGALQSTWSLGIAAAAIVAGIYAISSAIKEATDGEKMSIGLFANGGYPDRGTLFYAGEKGAEIVYNNSKGGTGVSTLAEIEEANYRGYVRANYALKGQESTRGSKYSGGDLIVKIGDTNFVTITKKELAKQGYVLTKV